MIVTWPSAASGLHISETLLRKACYGRAGGVLAPRAPGRHPSSQPLHPLFSHLRLPSFLPGHLTPQPAPTLFREELGSTKSLLTGSPRSGSGRLPSPETPMTLVSTAASALQRKAPCRPGPVMSPPLPSPSPWPSELLPEHILH